MANISDWLISSRAWTTQTPTIDATPATVTAALSGLYLYHPTPALSLLARVVAAMAAAGVVAPAAVITESRHVRLSSSGTFAITWATATGLRDLLGYTGDLAAAAAYTAPLRSTLLYSPGKVWRPELAPLGAHGQAVADLTVTHGPGGRQVVRQEGEPTIVQRFTAQVVAADRYWAAPPALAAGEYRHFWEREIITSQRLYVLRRVYEGDSTTVGADYSASTVVGPSYRADLAQAELRKAAFVRSQAFANVEAYYDLSLPVVQCEDFS